MNHKNDGLVCVSKGGHGTARRCTAPRWPEVVRQNYLNMDNSENHLRSVNRKAVVLHFHIQQKLLKPEFENDCDHPVTPTPHISKNLPPNHAVQGEFVWHKIPSFKGISTENMGYRPRKYGTQTPLFIAYVPLLLGVGMVFTLLRIDLKLGVVSPHLPVGENSCVFVLYDLLKTD